MLETCRCCTTADQVLQAVDTFTTHQVKGMGPAAANMLYFLHPTLMPPFNTAIVNGYNALTGAKIKLGRWDEYLTMRDGILAINDAYRGLLSNDLGAVAGLLFDVGSGRYLPPPSAGDSAAARAAWHAELAQVREDAKTQRAHADAERHRTSLTPRCKAGYVTSGWRWVSACGSPATTAAGPTAGGG
jgi:type II restriction enzyme